MEINTFINRLIETIKLIQNDESPIIETSRLESDPDSDAYNDGDVTFIFNCAVYEIVKNEWEVNKKIGLIAEKPTGRGGYSDLTINIDGKSYINIEHENKPEEINKKTKMQQLNHCITKLADSKNKAEYKLLITYYSKNYGVQKLIKEVEQYVQKIKQENKEFKLYLLYSDWKNFENYKLEEF